MTYKKIADLAHVSLSTVSKALSGGSTVIAAIVAAVIYKEKLTVKSVFGIILGVLSFVIIKAAEI